MKTLRCLIYFFVLLLGTSALSACDNFADDDVAPTQMNTLILNDDSLATQRNTAVLVNVLANDTIGGQAAIQFSVPKHGLLQPDSTHAGQLLYLPNRNYTGPDDFTYQVCIGNACQSAKVKIAVN